MAPTRWSNLPGDILSIILKLLNSDVHLLRLRSVCSEWRSSLPTRIYPYSFPIKLPPFLSNSTSYTLPGNQHFLLNYSTLYRLSPPLSSSDGWLLRVLEVNPNTFSLLTPLLPEKIQSHSQVIPNGLNLLDYRISEICKCYKLDYIDGNGSVNELGDTVRKVVILRNFLEDCDFAVLILVSVKIGWYSEKTGLRYWKYGDKNWTTIDIKDYDFDDVIFFHGKYYAIDSRGELVCFDSNFNRSVVFQRNDYVFNNYNNFVVHKSDLYIVSKIYNREPDDYSTDFEGRYSSCDDFSPRRRLSYDSEEEEGMYESETSSFCRTDDEDECTDENGDMNEEYNAAEISLRAKILMISNDWDLTYFRYLEEDEFFLSSDDVSVGLSTKDFGGCKGNCVYMAHRRFTYEDQGIEDGDHHAVFDFKGRRTRSLILEKVPDRASIYWPPPKWLHDGLSSSREAETDVLQHIYLKRSACVVPLGCMMTSQLLDDDSLKSFTVS